MLKQRTVNFKRLKRYTLWNISFVYFTKMPKISRRKSQSRRVSMKRMLDKRCVQQKPQQSSEDEEFINPKEDSVDYTEKEMIFEISDIFSLCKERCNPRFLSTMVYMILKHFKVSFRDAWNNGKFRSVARNRTMIYNLIKN